MTGNAMCSAGVRMGKLKFTLHVEVNCGDAGAQDATLVQVLKPIRSAWLKKGNGCCAAQHGDLT